MSDQKQRPVRNRHMTAAARKARAKFIDTINREVLGDLALLAEGGDVAAREWMLKMGNRHPSSDLPDAREAPGYVKLVFDGKCLCEEWNDGEYARYLTWKDVAANIYIGLPRGTHLVLETILGRCVRMKEPIKERMPRPVFFSVKRPWPPAGG
jgi:hypothetical protein